MHFLKYGVFFECFLLVLFLGVVCLFIFYGRCGLWYSIFSTIFLMFFVFLWDFWLKWCFFMGFVKCGFLIFYTFLCFLIVVLFYYWFFIFKCCCIYFLWSLRTMIWEIILWDLWNFGVVWVFSGSGFVGFWDVVVLFFVVFVFLSLTSFCYPVLFLCFFNCVGLVLIVLDWF